MARVGREIRGFFSGMVRGLSDGGEGTKILTFLLRPRLVWKGSLALYSNVRRNLHRVSYQSS